MIFTQPKNHRLDDWFRETAIAAKRLSCSAWQTQALGRVLPDAPSPVEVSFEAGRIVASQHHEWFVATR